MLTFWFDRSKGAIWGFICFIATVFVLPAFCIAIALDLAA